GEHEPESSNRRPKKMLRIFWDSSTARECTNGVDYGIPALRRVKPGVGRNDGDGISMALELGLLTILMA
ncbi:MAG TPA: hypothetical protein VH934_07805, partial [Xanthobacteraceae bacterium]